MGSLLQRPVVTISCHDDLTSSDLVGRFMVTGGDVVWTDGPLTRAVKAGAICYLDEVVEARHDSLAILHSLTDHRRSLYLDRAGEVVQAPEEFMLVCSYNPAYRSSLKELKPSLRPSGWSHVPSRSAPPTKRFTSSRRPPGCWSRPRT
jgi:MoxR-like ATPase